MSSKAEVFHSKRGGRGDERKGQSQKRERTKARRDEARRVPTEVGTMSEVRFRVPSFRPDTIRVHTERKGGTTTARAGARFSRKVGFKYSWIQYLLSYGRGRSSEREGNAR